MKEVMVDLETLSLGSDALILSIGAVEFSRDGTGDEFYVAVKQDKQISKWGRHVDPRTMAWWNQQSDAARKVLTDPDAVYLDTALVKFAKWLSLHGERNIWGYGAHFDNVVLANAYEATGVPAPWSYHNNRCFRTLKAIAPWDLSLVVPAPNVVHNALDDARYQANLAVQYFRRMEWAKSS